MAKSAFAIYNEMQKELLKNANNQTNKFVRKNTNETTRKSPVSGNQKQSANETNSSKKEEKINVSPTIKQVPEPTSTQPNKKIEIASQKFVQKVIFGKARRKRNALKMKLLNNPNSINHNGTLDIKYNKISKKAKECKGQKLKKTEATATKDSSENATNPTQLNGENIWDYFHMDNDEMLSSFNSKDEALNLFKTIIHPIKIEEFFNEYWEKKPLLIKRNKPNYYQGWFSCKEFHKILRENNLEFTQNIDVTTYIDGVKQKHNPEGRAYAPLVWDFFQQGCSIRLLNPQTYSKNIWRYLSLLQEIFYTSVGANTYLTPAGCQGFAPHFDDIEAFALQLEGKKRWRVYKPTKKEEFLPTYSSPNFKEDEIGEPLIDCILETGDLLYFPRGFIHQANACDDIHSLHITVSCYQNNTYGHFLAKLLPAAISIAMREDKEFREGLPIGYAELGGFVSFKQKDRKEFLKKVNYLATKVVNKYLPIDAAIDQSVKTFLHDSLPPFFEPVEKICSIHGNGERWNSKKMKVEYLTEIGPDSEIKLIRKDSVRLVMEDGCCLLYHNLENSRIYQEKELQFLEVDEEVIPAIVFLLQAYPLFVNVEQLPLNTIDKKITFASCLYDKGLLMTQNASEFDD